MPESPPKKTDETSKKEKLKLPQNAEDLESHLAWQAKLSEKVWGEYQSAKGVERKVDPNSGPFFEVTMPNEEHKISVYEKEPCKMLW